MNAIVLPDLDKSTIDELRKRIPNLAEIELPSLELPSLRKLDLKKLDLPKLESVGKSAGKTADDTIDRLFGRSRAPIWPWVAAGIGLVALAGAIAAYFTWSRKPAWDSTSEPWTASAPESNEGTAFGDDESDLTGGDTELTASEASLTSNPYPFEES